MKPSLLFTIVLSLGLASGLQAQDRIYRQFATQEVLARLTKATPEYYTNQSAIERYLNADKFKVSAGNLTIPVVFHILYTSGETFPSPEEVNAQLEALNRDFGEADPIVKSEKYGYTTGAFDKKRGKISLQFCLAEPPKDFKKEYGIRYIPANRNQLLLVWNTYHLWLGES
jgi:hypothetical protein